MPPDQTNPGVLQSDFFQVISCPWGHMKTIESAVGLEIQLAPDTQQLHVHTEDLGLDTQFRKTAGEVEFPALFPLFR